MDVLSVETPATPQMDEIQRPQHPEMNRHNDDAIDHFDSPSSSSGWPVSTSHDSSESHFEAVVANYFNYTGGYCDTTTGKFYLNANAQTIFAHDLKDPVDKFHRDAQTVDTRNHSSQTNKIKSIQTERKGIYQSSCKDKVIVVRGYYETADEYHNRRQQAAIKIQAFFRAIRAIRETTKMRQNKNDRDTYLKGKMNTRRLVREHMEKQHEISVLSPRTKSDFEALYSKLEPSNGKNRRDSVLAIKSEIEEIRLLNAKKTNARRDKEYETRKKQLHAMGASKAWVDGKGRHLEFDTPEMRRSRELVSLYESLQEVETFNNDDRLKLLMNVKYTVQEFYTALTREILHLIDRECDWLSRGRSNESLRGLRQRLVHLFLLFIKTPNFNPAVLRTRREDTASLLQCVSCVKFLSKSAFSKTDGVLKCDACLKEYNLAVLRLNDKGLKQMVQWMIVEEEFKQNQLTKLLNKSANDENEDGLHESILYLDIDQLRELTEKAWRGHSAISGDAMDSSRDVSELIFTRWNIMKPPSFSNVILLTKKEAAMHDKAQLAYIFKCKDMSREELKGRIDSFLVEKYRVQFVQKIKTIHLTSIQYLSKK